MHVKYKFRAASVKIRREESVGFLCNEECCRTARFISLGNFLQDNVVYVYIVINTYIYLKLCQKNTGATMFLTILTKLRAMGKLRTM